MTIQESHFEDETSEDEELSDWQKDNMDYAGKMMASTNKVDQRLINLYIFKKASQLGLHFGLRNAVIRKSVINNRKSIVLNKAYKEVESLRYPQENQLIDQDSNIEKRSNSQKIIEEGQNTDPND